MDKTDNAELVDRLKKIISKHNQSCETDCKARKYCDDYIGRGKLCPDCPRDYRIDVEIGE